MKNLMIFFVFASLFLAPGTPVLHNTSYSAGAFPSWNDSILIYNFSETHLRAVYGEYKESSITNRVVPHSQLLAILEKISVYPRITKTLLGYSYEGREVYGLQWGRGPKRVMMWTQMHGDEPTATQAAIDLLHFLNSDKTHKAIIDKLADSLSLYIIPCLNPDGAAVFSRKNVQSIDVNRDALALETPEARILMDWFHEIMPHWGFNLHDQSAYYSPVDSHEEVYFSFLVPPINKEDSLTVERKEAMNLVSFMLDRMEGDALDGHLAKYPIRYEPRAFGEYMTQNGCRTILVETGFKSGDTEKQWLRYQHWLMLLHMLEGIAKDNFSASFNDRYEKLPLCEIKHHDLVIEHLRIPGRKGMVAKDLGFRKFWKACAPEGKLRGVSYLGSLGGSYQLKGRSYFNGKDFSFSFGKTYPKQLLDIDELFALDLRKAVQNGYIAFNITRPPDTCGIMDNFPFIINSVPAKSIRAHHGLSGILQGQRVSNTHILHNGYLHAVDSLDGAYLRKHLK
jgi:hypothetical protein